MSLMIFQGLKNHFIKKKIPWQNPRLAFRSEVAKHYSLKVFIIPSEDSWVRRINEEVHSTLVSGGFQVPSP